MALLERDGFLAQLSAAFQEARTGRGRVALISGEAGLGKTALVEHFARAADERARVLWGACDALFTPRPLGPLHDMAAQLGGAWLARLNADHNRATLFPDFLRELQRCPTLAIVEDGHWADEATLDLLKYVGRRITRTAALVVLTYRDDELGPRHPLRALLGDLATSNAVVRLALSPLSPSAVRRLVGGRAPAGAPLDAEVLHRQTGGNPFFLTEVLSNAGAGIPASVRDAVLARAARLSPSGQAVLQAAAVIGPRIEPWLLAEVTGAEFHASEECLANGMLVAHGDLLAFRHELARQAILGPLSLPQRLTLNRMTLTALRASPITRADLRRLAHHAEAAGEVAATLAYAPAAAQQAAAAGAHREAVALYRLAIRFADEAAPHDRAAWLEACAEELHTIGALEESTALRQQAIAAWRTVGQRHQEGRSLARLAVTLINSGQPAQAQQASQAALELLLALPPSPELAWAQRTQAHLLMLNRDCAEAIERGSQAVELAERFDNPEILARAYTTVGAAWLLVDYARGRALLEKCLVIAQAAGWEVGVANAYATLGSISCEVFRLPSAEAFLRAGLAYTGERDLDFLGKYMAAWQALTLGYLGHWEQARSLAGDALQGIAVTAIGRIPALTALGRLRARQGDADPWAPLDEALELARQSQTLQRLGLVRTARAEAAWLAGDHARTRAEAGAVYPLAASKQHPWFGGELAFWLWRAGETVSALTWMAPPFARHIAGDWRGAADAWQQLSCPYEHARALAEGDAAAQVAALARFEALGARSAAAPLRQKLQAAGVPLPRGPRRATRANPFGLTPRQTEILGLLAEGLTNAEIAARLHIAPKTADHHVSAVLARLGVRSREAAAALARAQPRADR